jgi:IS1 family transposase
LLNDVINDCKDGDITMYRNLIIRDTIGNNRNVINNIITDGNWQYHKQIKCNSRRTVKVIKDKKNKNRLVRLNKDTKEQIKLVDYKEELAKEENKNKTDEELDKLKEETKEKNKQIKENSIILKEIREEDYIMDPCLLHCNKHIIDKAETSLVETMNGSLRGHIARFIRRTKSFSKNLENLCDAVLLWIYRDTLVENKIRYASYCYMEECCSKSILL